jgi:hypothetical protein
LKEYGANFPLINEVPIKQWFWKEFAQQNEIDLSKEKEKKALSQAEQDRLDSLAEKSAGKSVGSKLNIEANRLKDIKTNLPKLFAELELETDATKKGQINKNIEDLSNELLKLLGNELFNLEIESLKKKTPIFKKQIEEERLAQQEERMKKHKKKRKQKKEN